MEQCGERVSGSRSECRTGFIGLSRVVLRRDDIESAADITVADQGVFFVITMGTMLLLHWRIPNYYNDDQ